MLVAVGACAINGGLPAQRNHLDVGDMLKKVYGDMPGTQSNVPNDPELPLLLDKVYPINEIVRDRLFHSGMPAFGRRLVEISHRSDRRAHAAPRLSTLSVSIEGPLSCPLWKPPRSPETLRRIAIDPVTRVEGHGKVTILLDDDNRIHQVRLHIVEFRGFEAFIEGRPYWEVPVAVQRLCGICPVSHHLAAVKAMDLIAGYRR